MLYTAVRSRALLLLVFFFTTMFSLKAQPVFAPYTDSTFLNEATIEQWLQEQKVPVLGIGIIKDGKLSTSVYGQLKPGVDAPVNTLFNVASLTKPVTAMVAVKLASQGKWKLDEPLYHYWTDPDLVNDPRHKLLTTRIVLTHQTGFSNWRWLNDNKKLAFGFTPGTKYQYSGEGFEYLRRALEKKFGKTLDQLASELYFQPLQMRSTQFFWNEKANESLFAIGYDTSGKVYEIPKNSKANAADDLLTTVEDYGKFLVNVMEGKGLSKEVFADMVAPHVKRATNKAFGLGFEKYELANGEYALSHGGADHGVKTLFFILPKSKQGLIIFTNADGGYKLYEALIRHHLGTYGQQIFDIEMKN
jgi:CubicO group peptidase (beta-lactamase class C family)